MDDVTHIVQHATGQGLCCSLRPGQVHDHGFWDAAAWMMPLVVAQDPETARGTCPICRRVLTLSQLYSEADVRPAWWHAQRTAEATAAAAVEVAAVAAAERDKFRAGNSQGEDEEEEKEALWTPSTKLSAVVKQLIDTRTCVVTVGHRAPCIC